MWGFLPLALVVVLAAPVAVVSVSRRADHFVTRVALTAFGEWVTDYGRRQSERRSLLQAVHVGETYQMYAAKTLLYAGVAAVVGSVLGVYLVAAALALLRVSPEAMRATLPTGLHFLAGLLVFPDLSLGQLFALLLASSATLGVASGGLTYWLRWENLSYWANARERKIDESIARNVAFVYALSRSGMAFPEILRTLARNQSVYGEAAEEVGVAVKAMDYAGLDMLSAIERLADQTPSDKFGEFADNLASVLQSGQSISAYLDGQYERYQEDAEAQQEAFLELLATLAEGYVSVFVVAPLLFITVLVIMGLMALGDTLPLLRALTYLAVPLANVGFVVYLDSVTESLRATREDRDVDLAAAALASVRRTDAPTAERTGVQRPDDAVPAPETVRGDGGRPAGDPATNFERLRAFENVRWMREALADPVGTLRDDPVAVLYATVPLGLLSVLVRAWPHFSDGTLTLQVADDFVVQAALFVVGTFAVVQELHRRRIAAIEAAVPDFLDRLASVNEAGMSVVESFERVSGSNLGALNAEVRRLWTDIEWGVDAETALYRFEDRLDTPTITRTVTLIANAMHASGDIARVLRIAADDAQDTRRLKQKRRQEMLTYVVIIYLSFAVFLVIVAALNSILIPNLPTEAASAGASAGSPVGGGGPLSDISNVDTEAYTLLFFHASLVQAVCSGLVAGQMGEGSVRNGAKHATILLGVAYVVFLFL
ncbi:type II secretion system F family protein [Halorussus sp. MSC15.2]|uniref:type II secretion system F family protein n=1 Tax=Halorussus sp. MSC15.2 TaxID=2283638 RepID=UPI0013D1D729|nr:type II secretion system F family protein [Halorussus sp. MSC15.2]NEU56700.1 type II secretion system protein [Halorussus sp. MSC15.2]